MREGSSIRKIEKIAQSGGQWWEAAVREQNPFLEESTLQKRRRQFKTSKRVPKKAFDREYMGHVEKPERKLSGSLMFMNPRRFLKVSRLRVCARVPFHNRHN